MEWNTASITNQRNRAPVFSVETPNKKMEGEIETLTQQVAEQANQRSNAQQLMTHLGVGPVTALATEVFLGDPGWFAF
jgi:hypothetical protein